MLLAYGWIVQLAIGIASIAISVGVSAYMRRKQQHVPEGGDRGFRANPAEPGAPGRKVYGAPWWAPPVIEDFTLPLVGDSRWPSAGLRRVKRLHTGYFNDGGGMRLKIAGRLMYEEIDASAAPVDRTLVAVDAARKKFRMPRANPVPDSIAIYLDGVLSFITGSNQAGGITEIFDDERTEVSKQFVGPVDTGLVGGLSGGTITGGLMPLDGLVDDVSVVLVGTPTVGVPGGLIDVPDDAVRFTRLADGRLAFYVQPGTFLNLASGYVQVNSTGTVNGFKGFYVAYTAYPRLGKLEISPTGAFAVFDEGIPSGVEVTAHYKVSNFGLGFNTMFRRGDLDQEPVKLDAEHVTAVRKDEAVDYLTAVTHETTLAVDNVVLHFQSGADGFFFQESDGQVNSIKRRFRIRIKSTSAPSEPASEPDVTKGWVTLRNLTQSSLGPEAFEIEGKSAGNLSWFFDLARHYQFTRTGFFPVQTAAKLPRDFYDVEVVAVDHANYGGDGYGGAHDGAHSTLFLAIANEVTARGFVFPWQSDYTLQLDANESVDLDGLVEVQFVGSRVKVLHEGATSLGTVFKKRYTTKPSRNNAWCAIDHIVDPVAGAGSDYGWTDVVFAKALVAGAYCDEQARNPDGSTETRSECDIAIGDGDQRRPLMIQLQEILSGSGVNVYWDGGFHFVVDRDDPPVKVPGTADDLVVTDDDAELNESILQMSHLRDEVPTRLKIAFPDEERDSEYDTEPIRHEDEDAIPYLYERELTFASTRRRSQVSRRGLTMLRQFRLHRRQLTLTRCRPHLLLLEPGDIVRVTSAQFKYTRKLFRVVQIAVGGKQFEPEVTLMEHDPAAYSTTSTTQAPLTKGGRNLDKLTAFAGSSTAGGSTKQTSKQPAVLKVEKILG